MKLDMDFDPVFGRMIFNLEVSHQDLGALPDDAWKEVRRSAPGGEEIGDDSSFEDKWAWLKHIVDGVQALTPHLQGQGGQADVEEEAA